MEGTVRRIIDLTHPITTGMPAFPGDPAVELRAISLIADGGYEVSELRMGTHAGTHIDAPRHCIPGARGIDGIPLDSLIGPAEVLDLGDREAGSQIAAADLDRHAARVAEGSRLLLRTGWGKRFGQPEFFVAFPGLTEGAALWLTSRKVALVALEQPSTHPERHLEVHRALLSAGVALVESMANLDKLTLDRVYLIVLPLNLVGLEGSPVRAVAIEEICDL